MSHVSPEVLSLRRQLRDASLETIRVRKIAERDAARADSLTSEIASARRAAAAASADVERLSREVVSLRAARDDAAAALEENNVYVKKLEVRVTGSAGSFLVEQNTKLRASLTDANAAHSGCAKLLDAQRRELERALREIEVLATALDLRASELSRDAPAGGSIQSAMLYEVSARRDEAVRARADAETERARADALEFSLREVRVAAATAAEVERAQRDRAAELGREAAEARAELKSERALRATLEHERDVSLDYVTEQSGGLAEAQLRVEAATKRATAAEQDAAAAISARSSAEESARAMSAAAAASAEALRVERMAVADALARVAAAESAAESAASEAASIRAQHARVAAERAELMAARESSSAELVALRETLKVLTSEKAASAARAAAALDESARDGGRSRGVAEAARLSLAGALAERDAALARASELSTRLTVALVENGRANEALAALSGENASLRSQRESVALQALGAARTVLPPASPGPPSSASAIAAAAYTLSAAPTSTASAALEVLRTARRQREADASRASPRGSAAGSTDVQLSTSTSGGTRADAGLQVVRSALLSAGLNTRLADEYARAQQSNGPLSPGEEALAQAKAKARAKQQGGVLPMPLLPRAELASTWASTTSLPL